MGTHFFGAASGTFIVVSAVPYVRGTLSGAIRPHLPSWALWTMIGFALLVTYAGVGAEDNIWPALFAFTNPLLITGIVIVKRMRAPKDTEGATGTAPELTRLDGVCMSIGVLALALWVYAGNDPTLLTLSLLLAILADACAAIPTIVHVWKDPSIDRPCAWLLFGVGYALAFGALPAYTIGNLALPTYMTLTAILVSWPLVWHRIRTRAPLDAWF